MPSASLRHDPSMSRPRNPSTAVAVPDDRGPLPWERQKGETSKAWWAFQTYRDLGATRSLTKVQEIARETRVASPSMIERWSAKWGWVDRAHSFDLDDDRKRRAANDEARANAARTRALAGTMLTTKGLVRLRGDEAEGIAPLSPAEWGIWETARALELGAKLTAEGLGDGLGLAGMEPGLRAAVADLARDLLGIAVARVESCARAAALSPDNVEAIIQGHVESLIDEARVVFQAASR